MRGWMAETGGSQDRSGCKAALRRFSRLKEEIQHHWLYTMSKTEEINMPRINLTFRMFLV